MRRLVVDVLERRRLFSGTITFSAGLLTASGSSLGNAIALSASGGGVVVKLDGASSAPYLGVTSIVLNGNGGSDNISVGSGVIACRINGGTGNDVLKGGNANDTLDGGAGSDNMNGGAGNDTADYSKRTAGLTIGIGTTADDGEANEHDNVNQDIETVLGGSGDDHITGSNAGNLLSGGGGNDALIGMGGNDTLRGGDGLDVMQGGLGADLIDGGNGNDVAFYGDKTTPLHIALNKLADDGETGEHDNVLTETVVGGSAADMIVGDDAVNYFCGGRGNDTLMGMGGNDFFDGGDNVYGPYTGPDPISLSPDDGQGADVIVGGDGIDQVEYNTLNNTAAGGGYMTGVGPIINHSVTLDGVANDGRAGEADNVDVERVICGRGNDTIVGDGKDNFLAGEFYRDAMKDTVSGGGGNDVMVGSSLQGGAGNDILFGAVGNSTLIGGDGDDTLQGESGNDLIYGNNGDDLLDGEIGNDTLLAGTGDDVVSGDIGADRLFGEDGDDLFINRGNKLAVDNDTLDGGNGLDIYQGDVRDSLSNVELNIDPDPSAPAPPPATQLPAAPVPAAPILSGGVLIITGTAGNDTILVTQTSTSINVTINGVASPPVALSSVTQRIEVNGGAGNDKITLDVSVKKSSKLNGEAGDDTITGGSGGDIFLCNAARDGKDVMIGGAGNDKVDYSGRTAAQFISNDGAANDGEYKKVNGVYTGEADNVGADVEFILAGKGADTVTGAARDDIINGGNGADILNGNAGNDFLVGSDGADLVNAGAGNDYVNLQNGDIDRYNLGPAGSTETTTLDYQSDATGKPLRDASGNKIAIDLLA